MAEEEEEVVETEQAEEPPKADQQKIMCFVSKKMVPLSETVEVEYSPGKTSSANRSPTLKPTRSEGSPFPWAITIAGSLASIA